MRRLDTMRNILKKAKTNDLTKIKSKALTPLMYDKDKHTFLQLSPLWEGHGCNSKLIGVRVPHTYWIGEVLVTKYEDFKLTLPRRYYR